MWIVSRPSALPVLAMLATALVSSAFARIPQLEEVVNPAPAGLGSCAEPVEIHVRKREPLELRERDRETSIAVARVDNQRRQIDASRCLPLPLPGPELYFRFIPPEDGTYRIAARALDSEGNVALVVADGCPLEEAQCIGGSDEHGPGAPELVDVSLAAGWPVTILVDGSFGTGGDQLGEVEVRARLLPAVRPIAGEERLVARVAAGPGSDLAQAIAAMQTVWAVDRERESVLGEATDEQLIALARQGYGVEEHEPGPNEGGPQPEPPTISFDRFRYDFEDRPVITLSTERRGLKKRLEAFVVSESFKDIEKVRLVRRGDRYVSTTRLVFVNSPTSHFDGALSAGEGDFIVAVWQDPRKPGDVSGTAIGLAMMGGRKPQGLLRIEVDPELTPPLPSVPGRWAGEPDRPIGALADDRGAVSLLGLDQVIVRPRSAEELSGFRKRYGAVVVGGGEDQDDPYLLFRFDPDLVRIDDAELLLELLGGEGTLRVSDPRALALLALLAEERLRGVDISPNFIFEYSSQPSARDEGGLNVFDEPFGRDCLQGLQRAWMYTSLFDRDRQDGVSVEAAVIDSNFCPRLEDDLTILGGFDFVADRPSPFGRGDTFGFGGPFHGTMMANLIAGRLNSGAGAGGPAGTVADLHLYNIGGIPFLFDAARAIRRATRDGARVISMSFGVPCAISGINFCNPATGFLCFLVGPILDGALRALVPFLPLPPGVVTVACALAVAALSSAESALESAVEAAERAGVACVASAGNANATFGPSAVEDFHIIPVVIRSVIGVGVTDTSYRNTQFFGRRVDVWTLEEAPSFAPDVDGDCPPFVRRTASGTSAGTAIVSGMISMMFAVNPSLDARGVRALLSSAVVRSPAPALDPRVSAFVRAEGLVAAAGSLPPFRFPDPGILTPSLPPGQPHGMAFDERGGTVPGAYGPTGACAWPPFLDPANDEPLAATVVPLSSSAGIWRKEGLGLHGFTPLRRLEQDWFSIQATSGPLCERFEISITVESLTKAGALHPEVAAEGMTTSRVLGEMTSVTWTGRDLFLHEPLLFQVAGDDNLYNVEVSTRALGAAAGDRFESNEDLAHSTILPAFRERFVRTEDRGFIYHTLEVRGLNFHCPDDVDRFVISLPEAIEDCLPPESSCGLGTSLPADSELRISAPGGGTIVVRDERDRIIDSGRLVRISCPRMRGFHPLYLEVLGDGRRALDYALSVVYRVPGSVPDHDPISEIIDEWFCNCMVLGLPCPDDPSDPGSGGGEDSFEIDLWSPRFIGPQIREFFPFCPDVVCNPPPTDYHVIDWAAGNPAAFELLVITGGQVGPNFLVELLDMNHELRGLASPLGDSDPNFEAGAAPGEPAWVLSVKDLPDGVYFLRVRGLERGHVYALENLAPLPPLSQDEPPVFLEEK